MPRTKDLWYIRFPDGRVRRVADPAFIREQVTAGRLPPGTPVRRSREEEWRSIERIPEFADIKPEAATNGVPPVTIASRLDAGRLHLAGVRGLAEELLAALDSTLSPRKLTVAAFAGLMLGALAALSFLGSFAVTASPGLGWLLPPAALLVWSWLAVVLTKMTYKEVSLLRPARWREGLSGSVGATIQLALAQAVIAGVLAGAIVALRWLPGWLSVAGGEDHAAAFHIAAQAATVAGTFLELFLWPPLLLLLPMAALFVVEQSGFVSGLGQWLRLVGRKPGRLLLTEGLALGVGLLLAAPLALLAAALASRFDAPELALAAAMTRWVLFGLLGAVFLAYLAVANVFIYLNLRYEAE